MTPAEPTRPEVSAVDQGEPRDRRAARARRTAVLAAAIPAVLLPLAPADAPESVAVVVNPHELALMQMRALPAQPAPPRHLAWPATDPVTSEFGPRWGRAHNGIDIDGHTGDPVTAAADGEVLTADYDGGYGLTVIIRHTDRFAGLTTSYAHLSSASVVAGDRAFRGELIGTLGATGNAVGDHLHFEVRRGDVALNPRRFLAPGRAPAPD